MNPIEVVAFCVILTCAMIPIVKEYLDEDELLKFREELHKYDIDIGEHQMTSWQKRRVDIQTKDLVEGVRCKPYENDFPKGENIYTVNDLKAAYELGYDQGRIEAIKEISHRMSLKYWETCLESDKRQCRFNPSELDRDLA